MPRLIRYHSYGHTRYYWLLGPWEIRIPHWLIRLLGL
jgi:hypothetical protein